MTAKDGRLSWAAKRAMGMTKANERRRRREPPIIDWGEAIANFFDILDHEPSRGPVQPQAQPLAGRKGWRAREVRERAVAKRLLRSSGLFERGLERFRSRSNLVRPPVRSLSGTSP
jgi:hypothetical protein